MRVTTKMVYPYKLRVFEDGKIKSKGLQLLSKDEYAKYNPVLIIRECETITPTFGQEGHLVYLRFARL